MKCYNIAGVMAMLLVAILIVACGPDVQPARESAVPADAPTPADTPTPRVELPPLSTPIPTTAFTARPGMDLQLTAEVIQYERREAEGVAAGKAEPELIRVRIFVLGPQEREDIVAFLAQQGVEHSISEYVDSVLYATIPASLLTTLAAHPSFGEMERVIPRYPNLNQGLNNLAAWYEAGMMPEEDANPTYAALRIDIEGDANYDKVRQLLKDNGSVMRHEDADADARWKPVLMAFVPVRLLPALARQPGVRGAHSERYPVPKEMRFTTEPIKASPRTPDPTPTATPTAAGATSAEDGVSGTAGVMLTPAGGAILHGADSWHTAGIRGQVVEMGIIDAGPYRLFRRLGGNPAAGLGGAGD